MQSLESNQPDSNRETEGFQTELWERWRGGQTCIYIVFGIALECLENFSKNIVYLLKHLEVWQYPHRKLNKTKKTKANSRENRKLYEKGNIYLPAVKMSTQYDNNMNSSY